MPKGDKYKLKADPEDGTTPVANLLLEAVAIARLSGKERGAILYLWRKTYGWQDKTTGARLKERIISLDEWKQVLQTDEYAASKVLASLVQKNILNRQFLGPGKGYIYRMNTLISSWDTDCLNKELLKHLSTLATTDKGSKKSQPLSKMTTLVETDKTTLVKNDNPPLSKMTSPSDTNLASLNKDNKENIKEKNEDHGPPSLNEDRKKVFEGLEDRRGYASPKAGAEAKAITWMLKQGYKVEDILSAHDKLKKKPFWVDKFLGMQSLKSQIGELIKEKSSNKLPTWEELEDSWKGT